MAKKVNKEELTKIQDIVGKMRATQNHIGNLEIEKVRAVLTLNGLENQMNALQNELVDKYGDVNVNIQDGTLKPKEDEQINKEN